VNFVQFPELMWIDHPDRESFGQFNGSANVKSVNAHARSSQVVLRTQFDHGRISPLPL